jgi:hypothetical protein
VAAPFEHAEQGGVEVNSQPTQNRRTLLLHAEIVAVRKASAAMSLATVGPKLTTPMLLNSKAFRVNEIFVT